MFHEGARTEKGLRARAVLPLAALAMIVAAGAWLRFHELGAKSFWTDEGVSVAFTRLDWYDFGRILWRREANMTLYYLLLRAWTHVGDSVAMIRTLSVIPSLATIVVIYAIGQRLYGSAVGLAAALLLSVNAYSVRYAQEARSYSLVLFLVTLATYFFINAVERGRKRDWQWYIAASALAIYAQFFGVLVVVAHWASLKLLPASRPREGGTAFSQQVLVLRGEFKRAAKRIALWTLPIWVFIVTTGAGPLRWIHRPGPQDLYWFFEQSAGNGGTPLFWLYLACAVLGVMAIVRMWRRHPEAPADEGSRNSVRWRYALPLAWFAAPVLIAVLFSLARPVFLPRYVIICLPALVLLSAMGMMSFRRRWTALPVLALVCWFAVGGVRSYYEKDFDIGREDFRGAAEYVVQHAEPGDIVLFHKGQGRFAYSYYAARIRAAAQPTIVAPGHDQPTWHDFMGTVTPQEVNELERHSGRVWLVLSQNIEPTGEDALTRQMKAALGRTHRCIYEHHFAFVEVYLYGRE